MIRYVLVPKICAQEAVEDAGAPDPAQQEPPYRGQRADQRVIEQVEGSQLKEMADRG